MSSLSTWEGMWQDLDPGTAFDVAQPSKCLEAVIDSLPIGKTLVPGAGRAYDAALLASKGNPVIALDISKTAIKKAGSYLASLSDDDPLKPKEGSIELICDDFFEYSPKDGPFDLVWDCTFLCALDPSQRQDWAKTTSSLLGPKGVLCTMIFPIGKADNNGPPYNLSLDIVQSLLSPLGFEPVSILDLPPGTHMPKMPFGNTVVSWRRK